jgi:hypothetical protein
MTKIKIFENVIDKFIGKIFEMSNTESIKRKKRFSFKEGI